MTTRSASESETDEVIACARAYEEALVAGDVMAASAWFDEGSDVSRFGQEGEQFGWDSIAVARSRVPQPEPALWLHESCRHLGGPSFVHVAVLQRGDVVVRRTQIWQRRGDQWRIAHAHVSNRSALAW
jgi:ketosteroid isomerase-like protein